MSVYNTLAHAIDLQVVTIHNWRSMRFKTELSQFHRCESHWSNRPRIQCVIKVCVWAGSFFANQSLFSTSIHWIYSSSYLWPLELSPPPVQEETLIFLTFMRMSYLPCCAAMCRSESPPILTISVRATRRRNMSTILGCPYIQA